VVESLTRVHTPRQVFSGVAEGLIRGCFDTGVLQLFAGYLILMGLLSVLLAVFLIKTHIMTDEHAAKKQKRLELYITIGCLFIPLTALSALVITLSGAAGKTPVCRRRPATPTHGIPHQCPTELTCEPSGRTRFRSSGSTSTLTRSPSKRRSACATTCRQCSSP
jgi:hypothetical protein